MDQKQIEELLAQVARVNTQHQNDLLYRALRGVELFFRIRTEKKVDPRTGQERDVAVSSPLLRLHSGQHAFMVYTSKEDERLTRPFGGATWERTLTMLVSMQDADGMIVTSPARDSVALDKETARLLVDEFGLNRNSPGRARHRPD